MKNDILLANRSGDDLNLNLPMFARPLYFTLNFSSGFLALLLILKENTLCFCILVSFNFHPKL